jgi:hypothetical protein
MISRTTTLAAATILLLAGTSHAQTETDAAPSPSPPIALSSDAAWHVVLFTPGDASATSTVNDGIRSGYIPVGFEVTPGESLAVLLVRSGSFTVESWAILEYTDWNALESEITGGINDGFVPMDISRYEETLAVLWVRTPLEIEGWRVSTSPNTIADRTRTVNDFQSQGFTLWGISVYEGLAWYLFLRQPGIPPAGTIAGFGKATDLLQSGLREASQDGWLPNGLAASESTFFVCFVR